MSYCRFSSDDFQCDVYVYADCGGGYTTHIARVRPVYTEPLPPLVDFMKDSHAYFERMYKVGEMLDRAEKVPIGLPHDGETFNHETAKECAEFLTELKTMGYKVPQDAIDALNEEEEE